jgi:glycosyltransferase involved in cell wall biosynthesis
MKDVSIIVEFENATLKGLEELSEFVTLLKDEVTRVHNTARFELLCAYPGANAVAGLPNVQATLSNIQSQLKDLAEVRLIELPGLRYYELKNEAAKKASGDVIVFLDSDIVVQPGWLDVLLKPFDDPEVQVSAGLTGFFPEDFLSRTFALIWAFPLPSDRPEKLERRGLNANNVAFRRDWFLRNPYPYNDGFKVSCAVHARRLQKEGVKVARPHAVGYHRFWADGFDFILWRALVTGRDADRKLIASTDASRSKRARAALSRWAKTMRSKPRRILQFRRHVSMPWYEVVPAIGVSWAFYTTVMVAQLGSALGLSKPRVEHLPERFHAH